MDHKAFSATRRTQPPTAINSRSSGATFPFVQSMTALYNNTKHFPQTSLSENMCSPQWFIYGRCPYLTLQKVKQCDDWKATKKL